MDKRRSEKPAIQPEPLMFDPVLDFMRLLWSVEHGLQSRSKWMEATLGVTGPQRLVLRIVSERPGLSAGELALMVHLHPSTITGIVQRLVRNGLLQRTRDPHDRRRIRLRVRGAAQRVLAVTNGTVESAVTQALTGRSLIASGMRVPSSSQSPMPFRSSCGGSDAPGTRPAW